MKAPDPLCSVLHAGFFEANARDSCGAIGSNRGTCATAHLRKHLWIGKHRLHVLSQILCEVFVVAHDYRPAHAFDDTSVVLLLTVAMKRIRHKDRRTACERNISHCHGTATGDDQVRPAKRRGHVLDKSRYFRKQRKLTVFLPQQLRVRLPALMHYLQLYNTFSPDFESPYDS
jgi:hypothetical protein